MNEKFKPGDKVMGWRDVSFFSQYDIIEPFYGTVEFYYDGKYEIKTDKRTIKVNPNSISFFIQELYDEAVKKCKEAKRLENESRKLKDELRNLVGT